MNTIREITLLKYKEAEKKSLAKIIDRRIEFFRIIKSNDRKTNNALVQKQPAAGS